MASVSQEERLFNLVVALMATKRGLTKGEILSTVRGYAQQAGSRDQAARERQFERDKTFLREFGIGIEVEDDPAFADNQSQRYRIAAEAYEFPPGTVFTSDEVRLIALAGALWREGTLSAPVQRALTKLRGLGIELDQDAAESPVRITTNEPRVEALMQAAADRTGVGFRYLAPGYAEPALREFFPAHVFLHHDRWHTHGWSVSSSGFRTYLVSRIVGAVTPRPRLTGRRDDDPTLESVVEELERLWQGNTAVVEVAPGSEAQVRLGRRAVAADGTTLTIHYTDAALFADELCSYGPEALVRGPADLRAAVIARLTGLAGWDERSRR